VPWYTTSTPCSSKESAVMWRRYAVAGEKLRDVTVGARRARPLDTPAGVFTSLWAVRETMPRVPLLEMDEIPESHHHLFTDEYLGDRNIFRAWAHNPEVLEATLEYLNTLYEQVTEREKELVILKVAHTKDSEYEWHQHVDIARDLGVTVAEMRAIGNEKYDHFEDREQSLLEYTEAEIDGAVTDDLHDRLAEFYDEGQIVSIGLLVGFYSGLCDYIAAAGLPLEGGEFVGWVPDEKLVEELFG